MSSSPTMLTTMRTFFMCWASALLHTAQGGERSRVSRIREDESKPPQERKQAPHARSPKLHPRSWHRAGSQTSTYEKCAESTRRRSGPIRLSPVSATLALPLPSRTTARSGLATRCA
jgi:hypothetical protein